MFATARHAFSSSTSRLIAGAVASGLLAGASAVALVASDVGAADVVYVAPDGDDAADGSAGSPVRTITQAVRLADDGATVMIAGGDYHESVQIYAKEVHLTAQPGAEVVLDGARPVDGWTRVGDGWAAPWNSDFDRVGAPFTTPDRPEAGWPEQFFVDGAPLDEVASRNALVPGTFFHDTAADLVVIVDDPTGRLVEGSELSWGLYLNQAHGSSVTGLTVRRYATENRHMAAVRAYADDLVVRDVIVEDNARIGLSAMGARIVVERVEATANGHLGLHGHQASDLTMRDIDVRNNNRERFDAKHSAGGMKITTSERLLVEGATVIGNAGPGIWTDLDVVDSTIRSSHAADNLRSGIEIELSQRVVVVDNIVTDNGEAGIWVLESSDVDVWHNTALRNVRDVWVEDGDRADLVGVTVANNVLGGGADGAPAILNVDDWTERRSAADMRVTVDDNRYWLRPGSPTQLVSRWANWPARLSLSADIDEHRSATSQAAGSELVVSDAYPYGRTADDVRQPADAPVGAIPNDAVAAALGERTARPAGAITAPRRSVDLATATRGLSTSSPAGADEPSVEAPITRSTPASGSQGEPGDLGGAEIGRATAVASSDIAVSADSAASVDPGEPVAPLVSVEAVGAPVANGGWGVLRAHVEMALDAATSLS